MNMKKKNSRCQVLLGSLFLDDVLQILNVYNNIKGKAARINENKKREDASYFRASAQCNEKKCQAEYTFTIQNKPVLEGIGFVEIIVGRIKNHNHTESKI